MYVTTDICVFIRSSVIRSAKGALTCMCERSRRLGAIVAENLRICIFFVALADVLTMHGSRNMVRKM